ncbi:hypothetical protein BV22DRAFT_1051430 [Leucogyrophana mollusca]|uniref:Uncharacterized protein n=1 Tax=Leucogyrophana mollusca TaxID=85980 RepID=A0ACB8AZQ1_9AGAM|nr:hypothetical protein BV22DRAFT_1051430 [Leucogyrophana mollusca]
MSNKQSKQPSGSCQNACRASPLGESHDKPMDHESTEPPSAPLTMATLKRSRHLSDNNSRSSKRPPHGWVFKPFLQMVAHATGCPQCMAYIEHPSEVDSTSCRFAAAIEARNSYYADCANCDMLPGCDVALLEDNMRCFRGRMEKAIVTHDKYLHELRDQDSESATLKEELAIAQAQLASVSIPLVAHGGRGSGGSSKPTARGKAPSFPPSTSKPPLLKKGETSDPPLLGQATFTSYAKPLTSDPPLLGQATFTSYAKPLTMSALSNKPPAMSSLPTTASKPTAVPTSEKGKGPAALIPEAVQAGRLNQEVNPALFGYVTNESNSEEECRHEDETTQVIYEDNGASSSVPNPPCKTVARKNKGKAVETAPQAAEVQEDAPKVLPDKSIFYGRGVRPPGWLEGERGNQFFHFEGEDDGTLVVLIGSMEYYFSGAARLRVETTMANGAPPSLDGARQDAIPLFNIICGMARILCTCAGDLQDQTLCCAWIQAVVLEEWRTPTWYAKWREDHPPAAPLGASNCSNVPARGIHPKPEWKDWIEFYSKEFNGVPLEGGTVSLRDVRGHILVSRLNPTFEKGTSEQRCTIFWYHLCLLALVPGLYHEYLAMFAWPIAPMFKPVRFKGHVNNLTEDDVAQHLAQCGVSLHQVDDIQPYMQHWLSCCLDTCHRFLTDDERAILSERLLETIAREKGTELPDAAPASRIFSSFDDQQMSLLADPPTVHNLVTASATSGLVAGEFAANNPLADVDHEMATVVPNNKRQLIIGRPCDSPPPGKGAVSLDYREGDVPVNMSVDTANIPGDPTGHPNVPANEAPPS